MMILRLFAKPKLLASIAAAAAFLGLHSSANAQVFNCYEGQGVLENAWQDWSWCPHTFNSTAYTLLGTQSIQVTYTAGYQGFSLESPNSFAAGYFSALTFYINGGKNSVRNINVQLTVNGGNSNAVNLNNYVAGGHVLGGQWLKVTIPLSAFNLKPTDQISRFWLQEAGGTPQPPFYLDGIDWAPVAPPSSATLTLNTATNGKAIDPLMLGVNTAVWDSNLNTTACKTLIANAGFKSFRFPGGSLSDSYHFATNTTPGTTWATNFDAFASVAAPNKGADIITVNYGTGTPQEAAVWVHQSNVIKKYGMKYWEVGNEVYGTWETDSHAQKNDPVTYATQFAQYYAQMKAQDSSIMVGAVATTGEDSYVNYPSEVVKNPVTGVSHSGWTPVMLSTLAGLGVKPDFIVYHRYPEYGNDCDFTLLAQNNTWVTDMQDLRTQLNDYLGTKGAGTQIFCTETNCDAGPEGKQMCSIVNGLFMADSFGTMLQTECKCMTWWDIINGQDYSADNSPWLYGWRMYGDEGIFSPDLTQLYPVYYVEQLMNLFAAPGDQVTSVTSSYNLLDAYATKRSDGSVRLMVVNKNPTATISSNLLLGGYATGSTATMYTFGINEDNLGKAGKPESLTTTTLSNVSATTPISFSPYSVNVIVLTPVKSP